MKLKISGAKKIAFIFISILSLALSGCAYNGLNVKSENQKFALAIKRFEFLRHTGVPKVSVHTSSKAAGYGAPAVIKKVKTASAFHFQKPVPVKWKEEPVKKVIKTPATARIVGKTNGLPVLTVDFVNKPLWKALQDVSNDTGYVFTTKGVNLAKKINLKGRYNFAVLLSKLFNGKGENATVNLKTKRVKIWR